MKPAIFFSGAIIIFLVLNIFYISTLQTKDFTISDFRAQYTGAFLANSRRYTELYNLETQYEVQKNLLPKLGYNQLLPFFSPPLVAFLLSPLALFNFQNAYVVFGLSLTLVLLLTSLLFFLKTRLSKKVGVLFKLQSADIFLILISFFPFWLNILSSQLSLFWILILFFTSLQLEKKKYFQAGLVLSLLSLKIHLLFVPLIFFTVQRNWKIIKGVITGTISLYLLQAVFFGLNTLEKYFKLLFSLNLNSDKFSLNPEHQVSLKGALHWFLQNKLDSSTIFSIWLITVVLIITASIIFWLRSQQTKADTLKLQWSAVIIITLFTSPHTHYHDLSLLIIPIFLILQYLLNRYLPDKQKLPGESFYPLIKYGLMLGLIIFSALIASFPPVSVIVYILLLSLIYKLLFALNPSINP